jgi:hypothetical protein
MLLPLTIIAICNEWFSGPEVAFSRINGFQPISLNVVSMYLYQLCISTNSYLVCNTAKYWLGCLVRIRLVPGMNFGRR